MNHCDLFEVLGYDIYGNEYEPDLMPDQYGEEDFVSITVCIFSWEGCNALEKTEKFSVFNPSWSCRPH